MNASVTMARRLARVLPIVLTLSLVTAALGIPASAVSAAEPSESPAAAVSAEPSPTVQEAFCESADTLGLIVEFLRDTSQSEGGLLPALVGVIAGLSVARDLAAFAGEAYRPLVDDVVVSLQELRMTVEASSDDETLGATIAAVGQAITEIGMAMEVLSLALADPCPAEVS